MARLSTHAAFAWVHGRDKLEPGRVGHMVIGAGNHGFPGFHRLAQCFERPRLELGQLVKKQHAIVGEHHLARQRPVPATHKSSLGRRVMRCTEGADWCQAGRAQLAGNGRDRRNFQHLGSIHRRQNGGHPRGQHGLTRAGRTHHQHVMTTCSSYFECTFGGFLALHVPEVRQGNGLFSNLGLWPGQNLRTLHVIEHLDQRPDCQNVQIIGCPRSFGTTFFRADQSHVPGVGGHRRRQYPVDRLDLAIE